MSALLGVSGAKRNACAAICVDGQIRAACEQERLTRVRGIGFEPPRLPLEAMHEVLALAGCRPHDVTSYVVAEQQVRVPTERPRVAVDHHHAHAATAFLTSSFQRAAVLVCDSDADRELSVWLGEGTRLRDQEWPSRGCALATLYSDCAELFEFTRHGQEHKLEALAHLGQGDSVEQLRTLFRYVDGALEVDCGWRTQIDHMIGSERRRQELPVETASAVQRRIGELLLELVGDIRATLETDTLCLGGGLFYNSYFNTLVRRSGLFKHVFVPLNAGNAGLSVGATLMVARENGDRPHASAGAVSPFLGPEYDSEAIKATLDGCKLSYGFVTESEALDAAVEALARGQLVGWFQGRMEWGHRALGHRSILANPESPYVLDNLNFFLRKRERWRAFGVSVCEDRIEDLFCGPPTSPFMEYQYGPRDPDRWRHVMPAGATAIRVQTVAAGDGPFWALHRRMEQATGTGVLVNTSFNGFHEPIVCSPRDAIRVFYGTGLDMLVIGQFIVRK
jgi:carbamoyltransferase